MYCQIKDSVDVKMSIMYFEIKCFFFIHENKEMGNETQR